VFTDDVKDFVVVAVADGVVECTIVPGKKVMDDSWQSLKSLPVWRFRGASETRPTKVTVEIDVVYGSG
jgi:hypothetical protein